jgi:hypothetical protein
MNQPFHSDRSMKDMDDHSERNCSQKKGERWPIASVSGRVCLGKRQREDKASNIAAFGAALGAHPFPYVATACVISVIFFWKKIFSGDSLFTTRITGWQ